jgi:hypothetical protein
MGGEERGFRYAGMRSREKKLEAVDVYFRLEGEAPAEPISLSAARREARPPFI